MGHFRPAHSTATSHPNVVIKQHCSKEWVNTNQLGLCCSKYLCDLVGMDMAEHFITFTINNLSKYIM
jgi:hypothetical protein